MKHAAVRLVLELAKLFTSIDDQLLQRRSGVRAELGAANQSIRRLQVENELLRARLRRIEPTKRPRFKPWERLTILLHRVRYRLSLRDVARTFVLTVETVSRWIQDVERDAEKVVKARVPVNKIADAVREVARLLKWDHVRWGSRRIAQVLQRMRVRVSRTTVQRALKSFHRKPAAKQMTVRRKSAGIRAKREHHVWLVDITTVKALLGLVRVHVAAAMDAYTRAIVAIEVCRQEPTAEWMAALVTRAVSRARRGPTHLITDQGAQFTSLDFRRAMRLRGIRQRFGAVGQHGSCSLIERFIKSLKTECLDSTCVWMAESAILAKAARYVRWYSEHRPHQGLGGRTPREARRNVAPRTPLVIGREDRLELTRWDPVYALKKVA
jgi:transposase InsO family protein